MENRFLAQMRINKVAFAAQIIFFRALTKPARARNLRQRDLLSRFPELIVSRAVIEGGSRSCQHFAVVPPSLAECRVSLNFRTARRRRLQPKVVDKNSSPAPSAALECHEEDLVPVHS